MCPAWFDRFMPFSIGANHCRLKHLGWERCGHGLTSRPRKTASDIFLNELLVFFRYPPGSAPALMAGNLSLKYCAAKFAGGKPTWRLPAFCQVARLVTHGEVAGVARCAREVGVAWVSGSGRGGNRVRLNRKTAAHLVLQGSVGVQSRSKIWRDFAFGLLPVMIVLMRKGGDCISMIGIMVLGLAEDFSGVYRPTSSRCFLISAWLSACRCRAHARTNASCSVSKQ